jgi:hypothetical protein
VGFPTAIYAGFSEGINQMIIYLAGLVLLTSIYYARAITEERIRLNQEKVFIPSLKNMVLMHRLLLTFHSMNLLI